MASSYKSRFAVICLDRCITWMWQVTVDFVGADMVKTESLFTLAVEGIPISTSSF
jgi:hypothetical protein